MPIYEYRCTECGKVFARLQSVSASADAMECPECKSIETERLLSTFAAGSSTTKSTAFGGPPSCGGSGGG